MGALYPLIVKKFGGTSVGSLARIQAVATQLIAAKKQGERLIVVVSAMTGETDRLIDLAYQLSPQPDPREFATLLSCGEQVSMSLLAITLQEAGYRAKSFTASQLGIETDQAYLKARILKINIQKIRQELEKNDLLIIAGFQGMASNGDITTLGRGGSDTSAVALACALEADECQIFTDVDGIYTADPRLVPTAKHLNTIDFKAMLELASLGSRVLQWRSVALAGKYRIPLRVLSSFKEGKSTLIDYFSEDLESAKIIGLSHQSHLQRWIINTSREDRQALNQLASYLSQNECILERIYHAPKNQNSQLNLLIAPDQLNQINFLLLDLCKKNNWQYEVESNLARIALVGMGLKLHPDLIEKILILAYKNDIIIQEVNCYDSSLIMIINEEFLNCFLPLLHQTFFE